VRGTARTFENNVIVRIRDAKGALISERFTTSRGQSGQHNPFSIDMFATRDPGPSVTVEALEYSAKDGSERSVARVTAPFDVELVDVTIYAHDPARAPAGCRQVFPRKMRVPKSIAMARLLTEVLLTTPQFPKEAYVRSVNLRESDGVLTVDFNERLGNVGGSCRALAIRASVQKTLAALPGVRKVVITVNGNAGEALQAKLIPIDEGPRDASFVAYRAKLLAAARSRDSEAFLKGVDPKIRTSFGGGGGVKDLNLPKLWPEIEQILTLGGSFREGMFWAPYVYSTWPESVDAFQHLAVIAADVPLRESPSATAKTIATLSYDIVKRVPGNPGGWHQVETLAGQKGWVEGRHVRSPVGYRAGFMKQGGEWKMLALVAGD
jgi:hypothetical protein